MEIENKKMLEQIEMLEKENQQLKDKGYQIMNAFKILCPFLDQLLGRPFLITIAQEFEYNKSIDKERLNFNYKEDEKKENFYSFRDKEKPGFSFRTNFLFSSQEYFIHTPDGKKPIKNIFFPENLNSGVEITSRWESTATYKALKDRKKYFSIVPKEIFGVPLLAFAFPVFNEKDQIIGVISFSNDITGIISVIHFLQTSAKKKNDILLKDIADKIESELKITGISSESIGKNSLSSRESAILIQKGLGEIFSILDKLKILSLNTAIQSSKMDKDNKRIGVIAKEMKIIEEKTKEIIQKLSKHKELLFADSSKIYDLSYNLKEITDRVSLDILGLTEIASCIKSERDELEVLIKKLMNEIKGKESKINLEDLLRTN